MTYYPRYKRNYARSYNCYTPRIYNNRNHIYRCTNYRARRYNNFRKKRYNPYRATTYQHYVGYRRYRKYIKR